MIIGLCIIGALVLVAAVKQYMQHEASTLTEITALHAKAVDGSLSSDEVVPLNNKTGSAIGGIRKSKCGSSSLTIRNLANAGDKFATGIRQVLVRTMYRSMNRV